MTRARASRALENAARRFGIVHVAGVDEVGRGCLAGPVVAAAVILDPDRYIPGVADSKLLTAETRERLANTIDQLVHRASPKTIAVRQVEAVKAYFVDSSGSPRTDHIAMVVGGVLGVVASLVVIRKVVS